jgi:type II secretory pathway component PulF
MSTYYYRLLKPSGHVISGFISLNLEKNSSVRFWIEKTYDGIVISLYVLPIWISEIYKKITGIFKPQIRQKDLSGMLRDLAVMTSCGIPIADCITELANEKVEGVTNRGVSILSNKLLVELNSGASLSDAFLRNSDIFPESVCNLVKIGDETGTTDKMLMEAAEHQERLMNMKADTKQAMIYPVFVFVSIFGVSAFWIVYVIPNLVGLFKQLNAKLPPFTVAVLGSAEWLSENKLIVTLSIISIIFICWASYTYNLKIKRKVHNALHWIPVSKNIVSSAGLAFFAEYLSILIRAGLDVIASLQILENATIDLYYRDKLTKIRFLVQRGDQISTAMRQVGGFPPMMMRMIIVGENTGTLDKQLSFLAEEYRRRLNRVIATLSEIIKPLTIVLAGAVFLVLIIALMLPVYDLISQAMNTRS